VKPRTQLSESLFKASAILALLMTVSGANAAACTSDGLRDARDRFNHAIRHDDLDTIAAILAEDVALVTGTDSTLFVGRESQLALWRSDFEDADRFIYLRATSNVLLSPLHPIAMESGLWTGTAPDGSEVGGDYSAKWRCVDDQWLLEAEIFMTTRCDGAACL
jgi:ketosteroid isomerase-like protein